MEGKKGQKLRHKPDLSTSEPSSEDSDSPTSAQSQSDHTRSKKRQRRPSPQQLIPSTSPYQQKQKGQQKSRRPQVIVQTDDEQATITTTSQAGHLGDHSPGSDLESQTGTPSIPSRTNKGTLPERMGTKDNPAKSRAIRKFSFSYLKHY